MALSSNDAKIIVGMANRGDDHHDIAAWFGINQGRIAEALAGKYGTPSAAPPDELPPKGPTGMKGRRLRGKTIKAIAALESGDSATALALLKEGLADFNKNE